MLRWEESAKTPLFQGGAIPQRCDGAPPMQVCVDELPACAPRTRRRGS